MSKFRTIPFEFHILVGLPGSGKTYWATHNYPTNYYYNHSGRVIVDLDKFKDSGDKMLVNALDEEFKYYMVKYNVVDKVDVCIDGLITTYNDLYNLIYGILAYMQIECIWRHKIRGDFKISFIIHQWDENREICIYNDNVRNRDVKAKSSIKNLPYENINAKKVENYLRNNLAIENILGESYDSKVIKIEKIEHKIKKLHYTKHYLNQNVRVLVMINLPKMETTFILKAGHLVAKPEIAGDIDGIFHLKNQKNLLN